MSVDRVILRKHLEGNLHPPIRATERAFDACEAAIKACRNRQTARVIIAGRTASQLVEDFRLGAFVEEQPTSRVQGAYHSLEASKLADVADVAQLSEVEVMDWALAEWPKGREHQAWLDTAPADEVAEWVVAGRRLTD